MVSNKGRLDTGCLVRRLNIHTDWCWKGGGSQIVKGVVYHSKCIGQWLEVFTQGTDMICVRTLSPRPHLKKNLCVLEWIWADFAHGRDMNNFPHGGWLQWIYFINGPNCSPLPGSTPCSPWNFAVSSLCGQGSFLLGTITWFIDMWSFLACFKSFHANHLLPSTHSGWIWISECVQLLKLQWALEERGMCSGLSVMEDAEGKQIPRVWVQFSISNGCHSFCFLIV